MPRNRSKVSVGIVGCGTIGGELAGWTEEDFINTIRTGVNPAGRQLDDSMPWQELARWHDEDLSAVFKYLKSLPAAQPK